MVQVRKETLPWVDDLLQPFLLGQPEPLTDTVPPQQLGDPDSQWIEVLLNASMNRPRPCWCFEILRHACCLARILPGMMTAHCLQVDGVNLHYKDLGPRTPGAPAVLLLHGFNGSVFNW